MNTAKIKSYLEVATNLAVLVLALLIIGSFAWNFFGKSLTIQARPGLTTSKYLSQLRGVDYSKSPKTILIAMSTECSYCTASTPFYKQLMEAQKGLNNPVHIIGVFPEDERNVAQYLHRHQLDIDSVSSVDFTSLNIAGAPTIVFLDNRGRIINFWSGQLTKEAEQEVITSIR